MIAGKLSPLNSAASARNASSRAAADISLSPRRPSIQCRNRHSATASRRCAAFAPACSTAFLRALGSRHGSSPPATAAPAARSVCANQAALRCPSTLTRRPPSPASAPASAPGGCTATSLPSHARVSAPSFIGSMNSATCPSECTTANPRANGVNATSPPLTLSSQAIDAGSPSTAASSPAARSAAATAARFSDDATPACARGCGTTAAQGAAGRSAHTASTAFAAATRVTPASA